MYNMDEEINVTEENMLVPQRCIWCLREKDETVFDVSHVLPECVGNENMQALPKGLVCKECNRYFGTKVEPALLTDPLFHIIAVLLRLRDPQDMNAFRDNIFDTTHPAVDQVARRMHLDIKISKNDFAVDLQYGIQGKMIKKYTRRELALLSRAVHKIAFETLAWTVYVKELNTEIDVYSEEFNPVREWSRRGSPVNHIRPVVRRQTFDRISTEWGCSLIKLHEFIGLELNLFGGWYAVNLTSSVDKVEEDLVKPLKDSRSEYPIWLMRDEFVRIT